MFTFNFRPWMKNMACANTENPRPNISRDLKSYVSSPLVLPFVLRPTSEQRHVPSWWPHAIANSNRNICWNNNNIQEEKKETGVILRRTNKCCVKSSGKICMRSQSVFGKLLMSAKLAAGVKHQAAYG